MELNGFSAVVTGGASGLGEATSRLLAAKGMKVDATSDALKQELKLIGGRMTGEWLRTAGEDGKAIIDAFRKSQP